MYIDKAEIQKLTLKELVQRINRDGKSYGYKLRMEKDDEGDYTLYVTGDTSGVGLCFMHIGELAYWADCHDRNINLNISPKSVEIGIFS